MTHDAQKYTIWRLTFPKKIQEWHRRTPLGERGVNVDADCRVLHLFWKSCAASDRLVECLGQFQCKLLCDSLQLYSERSSEVRFGIVIIPSAVRKVNAIQQPKHLTIRSALLSKCVVRGWNSASVCVCVYWTCGFDSIDCGSNRRVKRSAAAPQFIITPLQFTELQSSG